MRALGTASHTNVDHEVYSQRNDRPYYATVQEAKDRFDKLLSMFGLPVSENPYAKGRVPHFSNQARITRTLNISPKPELIPNLNRTGAAPEARGGDGG